MTANQKSENILYHPFQLVNISQSKDSDFEQYQRLDYLIAAINSYRDFATYAPRFAKLVLAMLRLGEFEYNSTGMTYVGDGLKVLSPEELLLKLEQELTDNERQVMESFSEHFMRKGIEREAPRIRAEGRQEGRQEVAISLLKRGLELNFIAETTGLPRETIQALYAKYSGDH